MSVQQVGVWELLASTAVPTATSPRASAWCCSYPTAAIVVAIIVVVVVVALLVVDVVCMGVQGGSRDRESRLCGK